MWYCQVFWHIAITDNQSNIIGNLDSLTTWQTKHSLSAVVAKETVNTLLYILFSLDYIVVEIPVPKGKLVKGGQRRYVVRKKLNSPHRVTGFRYVHLCHDNASSPVKRFLNQIFSKILKSFHLVTVRSPSRHLA